MDYRILGLSIVIFLAIGLVVPMALAGPSPRAAKACRDGFDNDNDGYTDWPDDPGCANKNDNSELNPAIECDDGTDNDGDDDVDMADSGCTSPTDTDETNCGDGVCEGGETCSSCETDCGICDSCSDSDGGFVVDVAGTITRYWQGNPYYYDDFCNTTTILTEYECLGNYPYSQGVDCTTFNYTSCSNGACV